MRLEATSKGTCSSSEICKKAIETQVFEVTGKLRNVFIPDVLGFHNKLCCISSAQASYLQFHLFRSRHMQSQPSRTITTWRFAGRECVSPEINRNKNIGEKGANMQRLVFRKYLSKMNWSQHPVSDWGDLSYLLQPKYDADLSKLVRDAAPFGGPMNAHSLSAAGRNKVRMEKSVKIEEGKILFLPGLEVGHNF